MSENIKSAEDIIQKIIMQSIGFSKTIDAQIEWCKNEIAYFEREIKALYVDIDIKKCKDSIKKHKKLISILKSAKTYAATNRLFG